MTIRDFSAEISGSWVRCVIGVGYTGCEGITGLILSVLLEERHVE